MSISGNWDRRVSRRTFLGLGGMSAAAPILGSRGILPQESSSAGYGELVSDPGGVIDLPPGFKYRIISEEGSTLSSGAPVPGDHDGMAAFKGKGDTTVLVRNHELGPSDIGSANAPVPQKNPYDPAAPAHLAPRISGELAEAAEKNGMGLLEAAAFASLGVPLV